MSSAHRDPTFEIVAAREAAAQRSAQRFADKSMRDTAWRNSDEYRRVRQCHIRAAMRKVMRK